MRDTDTVKIRATVTKGICKGTRGTIIQICKPPAFKNAVCVMVDDNGGRFCDDRDCFKFDK